MTKVTSKRRVTLPKELAERLAVFDEASRRHDERWAARRFSTPEDRGWTRDDLYDRT